MQTGEGLAVQESLPAGRARAACRARSASCLGMDGTVLGIYCLLGWACWATSRGGLGTALLGGQRLWAVLASQQARLTAALRLAAQRSWQHWSVLRSRRTLTGLQAAAARWLLRRACTPILLPAGVRRVAGAHDGGTARLLVSSAGSALAHSCHGCRRCCCSLSPLQGSSHKEHASPPAPGPLPAAGGRSGAPPVRRSAGAACSRRQCCRCCRCARGRRPTPAVCPTQRRCRLGGSGRRARGTPEAGKRWRGAGEESRGAEAGQDEVAADAEACRETRSYLPMCTSRLHQLGGAPDHT